MTKQDYIEILTGVKEGELSVEDALLRLREAPFTELGFAKIDNHRSLRTGASEVVYGAGKTPEQILGIVQAVMAQHAPEACCGPAKAMPPILITRLSQEASEYLQNNKIPMSYHDLARIGIVGQVPAPDGHGRIVVATGGTSDIPVAEEAALTAQVMGNEVVRLYDVGVAGLHRLLSHMDEIMTAKVVVAVAGMEGALASVIGGLCECPVIAVPTSVGYGTNLGGLSALLAMLNSCASGVSVVNIDNGFGAGFQASLINHIK